MDSDTLTKRLQNALQIVPDAESRPSRVWEQEGAWIVAIRMSCNPRCYLAPEISRYRNIVVAFGGLCRTDPILTALPLLQSFINSQLLTFKILDTQHKNSGRPQSTRGKNPQDNMLARGCVRE